MWGLAWFWWLIIVIIWVMFIYFTFMLAASKGRSPLLWVIFAIFLPLIAVILLMILPPRPGAQRV
jgi:hypothetical protein